MRFSSTVALALPLLAAAQQSPLVQLQEAAQPYLDKFLAYIPNPNLSKHAEAAAAKAAGYNVDVLHLDNWKETIQPASKSYANGPDEWWVLMTGRNKTCFNQCNKAEAAFNETAALFATDPKAPHLALINCDDQPILCNSWSAGPPVVWILEVGAPGSPVPVHKVGINTTTTTAKTFVDLNKSQSWKAKPAYEGYFHPFDGIVAQSGLAVPLAYVLWVFAIIPSWAFMIGVSFLSRTVMSRRQAPPAPRPAAPAAAPKR